MTSDLLSAAAWECCAVAAGAASTPKDLDAHAVTWLPAAVPGTAAGALRAAGSLDWATRDYDRDDWWFRATFTAPEVDAPYVLNLGGVATLADVWVNGVHRWHGENMFSTDEVELGHLAPVNEVAIRCGALAPWLRQRRPRPRWRTGLVREQGLRFLRTTMLGRMPDLGSDLAPVGPWRPVTVRAVPPEEFRVVDRQLAARLDGDDGVVDLELTLSRPPGPLPVVLHVGPAAAPLSVGVYDMGGSVVSGTVRVQSVERWWPHTHGPQPLYPLTLEVGEIELPLGRVGFRSIAVDRTGGGFELLVNGVPIFCRGAVWVPPDVVSLAAAEDQVRASVTLAHDAQMNMLRVPGTSVYEDAHFFDVCDELGMLVWQDCMVANLDSPRDAAFEASLVRELDQQFAGWQGRPCLAVVSGGSEVEQQAAMAGMERAEWSFDVLERVIPAALARRLPDAVALPSSPTGGPLPFSTDVGVAHYFGVGAYLRTFDDVRRSGVRFAAECLAFSQPPCPATVDQVLGGPATAGHHPRWKAGVPRDAGRSWDFEDVRDHYVADLFGADVMRTRIEDPERYLDLGRAAVAECMVATISEWRRGGSRCAGALLLSLRDLRPGAGWGVIDSLGRPKSGWFVLRRLFAPLTLVLTDEGLNGLSAHVVNDAAAPWRGSLQVTLLADGATPVETVRSSIEVAGRRTERFDLAALFPSFRDLTYAYRFGAPAHDVAHVELCSQGPAGSDRVVADAVHLPLGPRRDLEHDLGLRAVARRLGEGEWVLDCTAERFAQWVSVEVPGFSPDDSWFHLVPGRTRHVTLVGDGTRPRGALHALTGRCSGRVELEERP